MNSVNNWRSVVGVGVYPLNWLSTYNKSNTWKSHWTMVQWNMVQWTMNKHRPHILPSLIFLPMFHIFGSFQVSELPRILIDSHITMEFWDLKSIDLKIAKVGEPSSIRLKEIQKLSFLFPEDQGRIQSTRSLLFSPVTILRLDGQKIKLPFSEHLCLNIGMNFSFSSSGPILTMISH